MCSLQKRIWTLPSWPMQEYLYAVVMAAPVDQKVVTVGLPTMLIRGDIYFWGSLMAGGLLVGVPAAVLFNVVIDRFIHGLTMAGDAWWNEGRPGSPGRLRANGGQGGPSRPPLITAATRRLRARAADACA